MKHIFIFSVLTMIILSLTGCAESLDITGCVEGIKYSFLYGIWHGFTSPFAFAYSIFNSDIAIYAINNVGWWYDFGFLFGVGLIIELGDATYKKIKKIDIKNINIHLN